MSAHSLRSTSRRITRIAGPRNTAGARRSKFARTATASTAAHFSAKVFKKYSHMKLQMKREALIKLNRQANEQDISFDTARVN